MDTSSHFKTTHHSVAKIQGVGSGWFWFVSISLNVALVQVISIKTSFSIPIEVTIFFVFYKEIFARMWGNFLPAPTPASPVSTSYFLCAQVAKMCLVAVSDSVIRCPCMLGRILHKL